MQGGHSSNQTWSKFEDAVSVIKACVPLLQELLMKVKEADWKTGTKNKYHQSKLQKHTNMETPEHASQASPVMAPPQQYCFENQSQKLAGAHKKQQVTN